MEVRFNDARGARYTELVNNIKESASAIFEYAQTEEEVYRLEQHLHQEIMYLAALAQSARAKPFKRDIFLPHQNNTETNS